jgi:hypothetical protein
MTIIQVPQQPAGRRYSIVVASSEPLVGPPRGTIELFSPVGAASLLRMSDGRCFDGLVPPLPCLALVGWSLDAAATLEPVQKALQRTKPGLVPELAILDGVPSWDGALAVAFAGLERLMRAQSLHAAELVGEIVELRRSTEAMQDSLAGLERFFTEGRVPLLQEAFLNEPRHAFAPPRSLRQILPISTRTLGAVAIHVATPAPDVGGTLHATVTCPELGEAIAAWSIPIARLASGWTRFGLTKARGDIAKTAVLTIAIAGEAGRLELSAGQSNALAAYRMCGDLDDDTARRSLALTCFVAPPGVGLRHPEATILPLPPPASTQRSRRLA